MAKEQGFDPCALTVTYGQRHAVELDAARATAASQGVTDHRFVQVELNKLGGSALTDDIEVPKDRDESTMAGEIPVTYVPARNTVMLSIALGFAEVVGANEIFVGVNAVDYSGYPDCRPEYIEAFQTMARLATKSGVEGAEITIHAPLIHLTKTDIVREGLRLGVDYSKTHSCYDPDVTGQPCGRCDSCQIRNRAFAELGMTDPALKA
jgi:7-cyano-7-deazaguanine synthase